MTSGSTATSMRGAKPPRPTVYDAKLNVGYCYVRAPFDAYVTNLNIASASTRTRATKY